MPQATRLIKSLSALDRSMKAMAQSIVKFPPQVQRDITEYIETSKLESLVAARSGQTQTPMMQRNYPGHLSGSISAGRAPSVLRDSFVSSAVTEFPSGADFWKVRYSWKPSFSRSNAFHDLRLPCAGPHHLPRTIQAIGLLRPAPPYRDSPQ